MKNKILTLEVLQGRGFVGSGRCPLCCFKLDSVSHMLGDCAFFLDIWLLLMNQFKIQHSWDGAIVLDNLQVFHIRKGQYSHLPFFVMWEVWKSRNDSIFSNFLHKPKVIYLKIFSPFFEWSK